MWQPLDVDSWVERRRGELNDVQPSVRGIIEAVRAGGDAALFDLTEKFDGTRLSSLRASEEEIDAAYEMVDPSLVKELRRAADNIERFHRMQFDAQNWVSEVEPGIVLGVKLLPMRRVGAYVPGGRASYPSTALMCVIPAKVAGVEEVAVCTPPPTNPLTLVALDIAGADEVFLLGGAQAVAAMALGTSTIRKVDKVVGPGNVYVTEAKLQLRDQVEIDFPAGPSEVLVIADGTAYPRFVAADILAQAEHDPNSSCVLVTTSPPLAAKVGEELESGSAASPRRNIIQRSLRNSGYVLVDDLKQAAEVSDRVAPEHLSIQTEDPFLVLEMIHSAGSVFLGPFSPVAAGDYASGTNHVLPTAGYPRTLSGLDVRHFCKATSIQKLDKGGLEKLAPVIESLAKAEGLVEHSRSVRVRLEKG
ncbi:MAG TPA: histidinol dehydrogenase [Methanomassiliicoccales archaeon]|nr:histidinol dehydrogenase [Methanomassiliicoccales archaeon]